MHNAGMEIIADWMGRLLRSVLRLVVLLAAGVFALSLLLAILVAVTLTALWSLITGRKPAVFTTFTHFQQATRQFRHGRWPAQGETSANGATPTDVVDVQAREVGEKKLREGLPLGRGPGG